MPTTTTTTSKTGLGGGWPEGMIWREGTSRSGLDDAPHVPAEPDAAQLAVRLEDARRAIAAGDADTAAADTAAE